MIGKIAFPNGAQLVLPDSGPIQGDHPALVQYANDKLQDYRRTYSPANGPFGIEFLYLLAEKLGGGEVTIEEKPPGPKDAVY